MAYLHPALHALRNYSAHPARDARSAWPVVEGWRRFVLHWSDPRAALLVQTANEDWERDSEGSPTLDLKQFEVQQ